MYKQANQRKEFPSSRKNDEKKKNSKGVKNGSDHICTNYVDQASAIRGPPSTLMWPANIFKMRKH